jgi:hypothetical protein
MSCHDKRFNFLTYLFMYARNLVFMFRQKRKLRFFHLSQNRHFYFFTICRGVCSLHDNIHDDDDDDDCDFDIERICFSLIIKAVRCFCSCRKKDLCLFLSQTLGSRKTSLKWGREQKRNKWRLISENIHTQKLKIIHAWNVRCVNVIFIIWGSKRENCYKV